MKVVTLEDLAITLEKVRKISGEVNYPLMHDELGKTMYKILTKDMDSEKQAKEFDKLGLYYVVNREILFAKKCAELGDAGSMDYLLDNAKGYARSINLNISEQIKKIQPVGYLNAMNVELSEARRFAKEGEIAYLEVATENATEYAAKIGEDVSAEVKAIINTGYLKVIPGKLDDARMFAEKGLDNRMEMILEEVEGWAHIINYDISAQANAIRNIGYKHAEPLNLDQALEHAEKADTLSGRSSSGPMTAHERIQARINDIKEKYGE